MSIGDLETRSDGRALDPADIHDVLRNDRRRLVLERLRASEATETVRDLAEFIAGVEADETPPPRNVRQSVYVSLHQTHLPKLDELGIVTYDSSAKEVTLAQHADEVAVYMEIVPKYALSWGEYYFGVGLLGLMTLLAERIGVPVLATMDASLLGGLFLAVVTLSAAYQVIDQRSSLFHRLRD
mgnify:FL=1